MEAAAAIGTQGQEDHPYEMDPFKPDVQTNTGADSDAKFSSSDQALTKKSTSPPRLQTISSSTTDSRAVNGALDLTKYRPRSSIPAKLPTGVYAQQCVAAAYACRLNPYALHRGEQEALQDHLCHLHVTVYLNIRNGILRLWTRNPMVSVTKEEAMGCAKDYRWMNLAYFAYEWLVRNGYINFGCLEIPPAVVIPRKGRRKEGPIILVIGAGMAGLGCARQLEGLFHQYRDSSTSPRVIILEGRRRIGGRIYSHPLRSLQSSDLAPGFVPKAEMGAQIIVGFDHGNPMDQIVRGQLALRYHLLRDISTIYDIDGSPVDEMRDALDERLYNDVLDRSGFYRHKPVVVPTAEGDRELIDSGRDTSASDGLTIRQYEEARAAGTIGRLLPAKRGRRGVGHKTADINTTSAPLADLDSTEEHPAALACQMMGWRLNQGISPNETLQLDPVAKLSNQTLGAVMDEGVRQYRRMLPLTPKDMRLLNWHFANLEYANATNVDQLSLSGWDQDMGNEFEGEHSQVIGGYQQVPYGLWSLPTKLDVRTNKIVSKISYDPTGLGKPKTVVHCEDGDSFIADKVVFTGSLGVLKHGSIEFSPPLPDWKRGAINRLGFGVMNKVILVFEQPFWDTERDMFGLLREPDNRDSMAQEDYSANRGRFYLFWNCMKTTGLPVLIALMAGDAAHQAERTPDADIIAEVTSQLRNVFKNSTVPDPLETIITRWRSDRFTHGSYSYVAAEALPGDYDLMAQSIGNLHFAGEATCGTHPATVHGAYLSGLRAASEVIGSLLGPIELPNPLVPEKAPKPDTSSTPTTATPSSTAGQKPVRRGAYEEAMWAAVHAEVGVAPPRPTRSGLNPFLHYQKDYWSKCRAQCDDARRAATGDPNARAARDEIRHALGLMWRQAPEEEKRPYREKAGDNRAANFAAMRRWQQETIDWEERSWKAQTHWRDLHPYATWVMPGTEEPAKRIATDHDNAGVGDVVPSATNPYNIRRDSP
ncbi:flavin-containing amine oxidoreductase-domain containing protein [Aspergillus ambiguus]|uniref:putative lysine-specific histone demethylase Aof2 n=1 Tax=Aspergillus ambiguus TaxID=176160 RepID=UPI003CCDC52B